MKEVLALLVIICACADPISDSKSTAGIKSTKYYQIADQSLREKNIRAVLVTDKEMQLQKVIVYGNDTIRLNQSKLLFCLQDVKSDTIYVFQFYSNNGFKRYTCTKNWNVTGLLDQVGEGILYPDIKRKAALDSCLSCIENPKE